MNTKIVETKEMESLRVYLMREIEKAQQAIVRPCNQNEEDQAWIRGRINGLRSAFTYVSKY